jgi:transposase
MKKIAYLGIDYHIKTVTIAVIIEGEKDFFDTTHMINEDKNIKKYLKKLSKNYEIKACYEASCNGYTFQRKMKDWGYHCDVIAPSLIPKKPGDHRKNDFRDARNLVQTYSNGQLTIVNPPTEEQESIRSLIRCRLNLKDDEKNAKLQINSFVLNMGFHWSKSRWTIEHRTWLSKLELRDDYSQKVLSEYLGHLDYLSTRVKSFDSIITEIANSEVYQPSVKRLRAFKGLDTLGAMILIAEITDFRRFPTPRSLMAYLGLIPSENSSDGKQKGDSGITKAGNTRSRKQLIESVQHVMKKPIISAKMKKNLAEVDAESANIAIKCMHRLHKRFWTLLMKGKNRNKVKAAVAREFVGFIWAMMTAPEPEPVKV